MKYSRTFKSAAESAIRTAQLGLCLSLGSMAILTNTTSAQAAGTAASSLGLTITLTTTNPNNCGFVTAATGNIAQTSYAASRTQTIDTNPAYIADISKSPGGVVSAIYVNCDTSFFVSAGSSNNGGFQSGAFTRNLTATASGISTSVPYILTLNAGSALTSAPTSIWGGAASTSCVASYNAATGPVLNTTGCYKSASVTSATVTRIDWGYYIPKPTGGWAAGIYTDTVQLSLNY